MLRSIWERLTCNLLLVSIILILNLSELKMWHLRNFSSRSYRSLWCNRTAWCDRPVLWDLSSGMLLRFKSIVRISIFWITIILIPILILPLIWISIVLISAIYSSIVMNHIISLTLDFSRIIRTLTVSFWRHRILALHLIHLYFLRSIMLTIIRLKVFLNIIHKFLHIDRELPPDIFS